MAECARHYATLWKGWCRLGGKGWTLADNACPVCDLTYVREAEGDRRGHRARHREVLAACEPKPFPPLVDLYAKHGTFIPITSASPLSLRRRLGCLDMKELDPTYKTDPCIYGGHKGL